MTAAATATTTELTDLERRNHRKVARGGWALYDLADTIWSFAIFSRAISLFLVDQLGDSAGNLWLGLSVALSVGINALVSPFLGAASDRYGRRLPFLFAFTVGAVVPSIAIPFVPVPIGIGLFCLAMFTYQSSLIYYDATLQLVSTPENRGRIASLATGVGYMGTVLIAAILIVTHLSVQMPFVVAPIMFFVLSLPTFILLKEDPSLRRKDPDALALPGARLDGRSARSRSTPGSAGSSLAVLLHRRAQHQHHDHDHLLGQGGRLHRGRVHVRPAHPDPVGDRVRVHLGPPVDRYGPKRTLFSVLGLWAVALLSGRRSSRRGRS